MTAEELLAQLEAEAQSETPVCIIDPETRTITVPPEYQLLGVENDKRVERIYFQCPKIVGDNQDLSQDYQLFMNYQNANGDPDAYHIDDMEVDGENITFSWLLEEKVTLYQGNIQISFCGIIPGDEQEDPDKNRWGTTINTDCTVLTGLKCTQQVAESNPDALAQIWAAIDELKAGGGGGGTPGKDGREIELQNSGTAIQWRYVGDESWTDLAQLSEITGEKGDPGTTPTIGENGNWYLGDEDTGKPSRGEKGDAGDGVPSGGTTGQVLTKNSDSDGDASWKNPSIVSDEQVKTAVDNYLEENPVQGGITEEQKQQLEQNTQDITDLKSANDDFVVKIFNLASSVENVFKNVVFKSANTESFDYLSNLVQNLKPSEMVTIKYSLTNCTIDNNVAHIMKGSNFTATIIPDSGTEFQSLKVTMGGSDVTETVVEDKTINITNVTGDIVITAIAKSLFWADGYKVLDYVYSSGNGDAYINTDWIMTDLKEKIVVGVQLSETDPTNIVAAFLGVNADSAFSSIYTAIELKQRNGLIRGNQIGVGWGVYQPQDGFQARHGEDFKNKIYYISLTNGEQKLWNDEDMNSLYTGISAINTRTYTMEASKIPPFPLWLFRSNIQDVAYQSATKKTYRSPGVKISCFKVYDGDGILTVNMRAAKRETDGAIGFYDTVRKRFFENECDTGELIGG